jgi:RecA/RadA recombinase
MIDKISLPQAVSLIYGPPGSGKTTFCHQLTAHTKGKVIFIDTENTFNAERLKVMNPEVNLDNVIVIHVTRFSEQFKAIKSLSLMKNISLVIVDSFTKFYRRKLQEGITIKPITVKMIKMLQELNTRVVVTSQIYTSMQGENWAVGGDLFRNLKVLQFYFEYKDEKRVLLVEKSGLKIPFRITNIGLEV